MFTKILIANRGEIACRVIKTAKRMGIQTVAVYSDADRNALHVSMADEAVHIGAAAASESYLVIDRIVQVCKDTGAQAVHPGYGFLSERAAFAERLAQEDIVFIGPPKTAIELMGDKITSKKLAAEAQVSTVPGHMDLINNADHAVKIASEIGYPVMLKASAGGGGKGMRIAYDDAQAREGFERSKSEAASSFGDDRIFIEKFIEQPRHIEIQVMADSHGNVIYLGERECSIQRRNQKVIEEAPSPFLDEKTRQAMGQEAVSLAKAVNYTSAGTVEFIVDKNRNFYFLEMNTRLQVEHPVTELITGVDLVEMMIRVANGEPLSMTQEDITLTGWAMESRLYAEDPYRNFLPSIGRLTYYQPPEEQQASDGSKVRNDTGVFEGSEISMFYDPMIAKLCTWGATRDQSITAMQNALDEFVVEGIGHNLPFLSAVMGHERFQSGEITTAFIEDEWPEGFAGVTPTDAELHEFAYTALLFSALQEQRNAVVTPDRFAFNTSSSVARTVRIDGVNHNVDSYWESKSLKITAANGQTHVLRSDWRPGIKTATVQLDEKQLLFKVEPAIGGFRLRRRGIDLVAQVLTRRSAELVELMPEKIVPDTSKFLLCPMPGLVVKLNVKEGDAIQEGQLLAIVEAMKMENSLRAEKAGVVAKIPVAEGDSLAVDAVIMEFQE